MRHRNLGVLFVAWTTFPWIASASDPVSEAVVYTALRPHGWQILRFRKSGQPEQLTEHAALDSGAVVSPDGRWLIFCSERRGDPDLFAVELGKGGSPRRLIDSRAMEDAADISPDGRWLAFVGTRDGNADVFVVPFQPEKTLTMNQATNLTRHEGGDFNPAFSPDGKSIAFSSDRDGYKQSDIYVMAAGGSRVTRLTRAAGWDGSPAWSRDGKQIYFYSQRDGGQRIYRMDADGQNQRPFSPEGTDALSPAVSPGGRIAYAARPAGGKWQIESAAADGKDRRIESDAGNDYWAPAYDPRSGQLVCHGTVDRSAEKDFQSSTPGPFAAGTAQRIELPDRELQVFAIRGYFPALNPKTGEVVSDEGFHRIVISGLDGAMKRKVFDGRDGKTWRPTWSKDGRWLACSVGETFARPGVTVDIWKFRPDGSRAVNLTDSPANDAFPDFSPDGRQIVFRSGRDGNHEIYVMNADGTKLRRLTKHEATDTMPAFSPDGRQIAFTSNRDGDYEIYLLTLQLEDTPRQLLRLTQTPGRDTHPKFSPDGKWLVFASERGGMNDETPLIPVFNPQPYGEIFAIRLADGKTIRLTHNKWEDGTPTWGILPGQGQTRGTGDQPRP